MKKSFLTIGTFHRFFFHEKHLQFSHRSKNYYHRVRTYFGIPGSKKNWVN